VEGTYFELLSTVVMKIHLLSDTIPRMTFTQNAKLTASAKPLEVYTISWSLFTISI
jgi:hypothetical protein